jgi:Domain of unknown function (DUF4160)
VPRISEFYGIVVAMFYSDHPPAHIHAVYAGSHATIRINPVGVLRSQLPRRAERMVFEWVAMHQEELSDNWDRAREHRALRNVEPLD